jgi:hypothetical protein
MEETRHLLRHLLATIAFRAGLCLRDTPAGFADFHAGQGVRTPAELVRHMSALMEFAGRMLRGGDRVRTQGGRPAGGMPSAELPWPQEVARLSEAMAALDGVLETASLGAAEVDAALQGPLADALTHVGQLATLRRLAGSPIAGAQYPRAPVVAGQVRL